MGFPVARREQRRDSLGLKLNLALLVLFLLIGGATAAFVFFGFNRTRDNARDRSQEALEQLGSQLLQSTAYSQADYGALQLEWAAEIGHRAARYLQDFKASGATPSFDTSRLVQTPEGLWYDPDPERVSDLVVPNSVELEGGVLEDIAYSAAMDSLYAALIEGFPGEISEDAYHPIAIIFVGVNGVGRYYPPIGVHQTTPAELPLADLFDDVDPEHDPERKTVWSTPYQDLAGRGLVITAQTPIYEDGVFRGLFEVDLSISELVDQVDLVRPTENGFAFYVDKEGDILRTGAHDLLVNELNTHQNQVLAGVIDRMKRGEPGVDRIFLGGKEFFLASAPILEVGGGFAVVAPRDELTAEAAAITAEIEQQADQTMFYVLASMTALFLVALILASYLNRRVLVRPIEALAQGTRAVAQGDFGTQIEVQGNDELAALGRSFNRMTADIQREVHEREAAQEELRALFAAMTDWVIVLDREGRYVRIPETSAPTLDLQPLEMPGKELSEIVSPEAAESMRQSINRALSERITVTEEVPYQVGDHTHWFSCAFSPISGSEVVMVARDITQRINAGHELEHQVQERTRELTGLLTVSSNIASNLALQPLLQTIIDQVKNIADYSRCSIFLLEGDSIVLLDSRTRSEGPGAEWERVRLRVPLKDMKGMWDYISAGKVGIEGDVRNSGSPIALAYQKGSGNLYETAFKDIHSWMGVPLESNDRLIGMLTLSHVEPDFYTERHAALVQAIAAQVAVAIDNARLYEQVQERTQELSSLLTVSRNVASTLELQPLLQLIVEQLKEIADFHRCSIFELSGDTMFVLDSRASLSEPAPLTMRISIRDLGLIWQSMSRGESVIIDDVHDTTSAVAHAYRTAVGDLMQTEPFRMTHSCLGVPLFSKDRIVGMLVLSRTEPAFYTERHAEIVAAVATQIAVAIENARLYEQAQQLAAVEERQRLARELHDSVSQALYGIALGARTARTLLDRDPAKAAEPVDYVLSLAEAGLAEMRALIFELRPESLEIEGLMAALDKQVAAIAARYGIQVTAELSEEPEMDLAQKEIFYRIGQEALHNIVKHSRATKATVRFGAENGSYVLEVGDNGVGFDADQSFPGHMGLVSMSERAGSIGAELRVESSPGEGTVVKLRSVAEA
jgi:PAS domain S-box-containing protein